MKLLPYIGYALYMFLLVAGGIGAVISKSMIRALVGLIVSLFGVAGMYFLLNSPFLALMQLLIYVGAVTILVFLAIMFTRAPAGAEENFPLPPLALAGAAISAIFPALLLAGACFGWFEQTVSLPGLINVQELGRELLDRYILAFELISVVLFAAMAGAVLLGFKQRRGQ